MNGLATGEKSDLLSLGVCAVSVGVSTGTGGRAAHAGPVYRSHGLCRRGRVLQVGHGVWSLCERGVLPIETDGNACDQGPWSAA